MADASSRPQHSEAPGDDPQGRPSKSNDAAGENDEFRPDVSKEEGSADSRRAADSETVGDAVEERRVQSDVDTRREEGTHTEEDTRAGQASPVEAGAAAENKKKKKDRKGVFGVIGETFSEFSDDNCTTMAAAVAYYTVFSLPPLLIVIITVAGIFLSPQEVQQSIQQQAGGLVGPEAAEQIGTMIDNAGNLGEKGFFGLIIGVAGLLFGATGAFAQLQTALNRAWEIKPDPEGSGILFTILKRILSLGMVLGIAFLLLVSLVLSAALSAMSGWLAQFMPGGVSSVALFVLDAAVSLAVITLLFAAIYKVLPDAKIDWKDVWLGGFVTAVLFVAGKFAIGFYLGKSNPGEAFGAAGSLALILVWVYYSAIIIFLGAEFTQSWAKHKGGGIEPDGDAVRMRDDAVPA
jgi:membrane protein